MQEPRAASPEVMYCRHVFWLHLRGVFTDVPAGVYACIVRFRHNHDTSLKAEFKAGPEDAVSVDMSAGTLQSSSAPNPEVAFASTQAAPQAFREIEGRREGFTSLLLGAITVPTQRAVAFEMGGNNPFGVRGLSFDYVQLVPLRAPWPKLRLLHLAADASKNTPEECLLSRLDDLCLQRVAQHMQPDVAVHGGTWCVR